MSLLDTDPLAGIDDVDWAALHHAYGPATDVPAVLRQLAPDPAGDAHVLDTYHTLYGNLYHQGSRYPATVAAIPFLTRLLAHPRTPAKEHLLDYLVNLAVGPLANDTQKPTGVDVADWLTKDVPPLVDDPDAVVARLQAQQDAWVAAAPNRREREARLRQLPLRPPARTVAHALAEYQSYCAVQDGLDAILGCLASPAAVVRAHAAAACAWFPAVQPRTHPALAQLLAHEPDEVVRASALFSLAVTDLLRRAIAAVDESPPDDNPDVIQTLQAAYNDPSGGGGGGGGGELVRWAAALGLLKLERATRDQRARVLRTRTADGAAELAAYVQQAGLDAQLFPFADGFDRESIAEFVEKETKDQ